MIGLEKEILMNFKFLNVVLTSLTLSLSGFANAGLIFSDVTYTDSSVTFTVNGDMSGYDLTGVDHTGVFALRYYGDIWGGQHFSPNTWTGNVFDGISVSFSGNTGTWSGYNYSWSLLDTNVTNTDVASNNTVTVDFGTNYLVEGMSNYRIDFMSGNGNNGNSLVLGSFGTFEVNNDVPEPSTLAIFALGLMGLASRRYKKQ